MSNTKDIRDFECAVTRASDTMIFEGYDRKTLRTADENPHKVTSQHVVVSED